MLSKEIMAVYHIEPINKKRSITDCQSRWFIELPLVHKGLRYFGDDDNDDDNNISILLQF
jgi:hypothetical protein